MLSASEVESFVADGYVAIRGAVDADVVRGCQEMIWSELGWHGVTEDQSTWTAPVVRIACPEGGPFAQAGTGPSLWEAFDQLIGAGRWWRRQGVGGTIPVRFPSPADPGDAGWHIEASYERTGTSGSTSVPVLAGCWRCICSATSTRPARRPGSGPGSHRDAARVLAPPGDARAALGRGGVGGGGRERRPAHGAGHRRRGRRVPVPSVPGPRRVVAAPGSVPRMMAQPGVALHAQFPLTAPLSPVERAILNGIGPERGRARPPRPVAVPGDDDLTARSSGPA